MKKLLLLFIIGVIFTSCSMPSIDPGHVGVLQKKPYIFGSGGLDDHIYQPGRYTVAWSSDLIEINVQPYKIEEVFEDMNSSDNVPVDFAVYTTLQLDEDKVNEIYANYGLKWYEKNVQAPFRTSVRNLCKDYEMISLTTDPAVSTKIAVELKEEIHKIISEN